MTTPPPPAKGRTDIPSDETSAKDALAGLPPMPKTKPSKPPRGATTRTSGSATGTQDASGVVTRQDLFARVKARTGKVKGSDVRAVMEAVLDEVGDAIVKGETLKLPGLGTLKVQRSKRQDKADVVICKLNRKKRKSGAKVPLAKPAEDR